ncbi:hypothetical protein MTP09_11595 [Chryseobacterium suipulveris]|uniref:Transcriptional regulator n=1 Tax=Chryseobacterium suipulveris TaxID=2929800 RepID=A0ABY4BP43_9FLAO|nr:hypothetical protein [Chryseobacterium suipulveris]UOE40544.1 hypothetical protein MTP09_11595 [Chryseobacterium suipulveris]
MKLLLITAIHEFEKNIKDILTHSGVKVFSYSEVKGFKINGGSLSSENWFSSGIAESDSLMFTVFVDDNFVDLIYERIQRFNNKQEFQSKIHIATLALENFA